MDSIDLIIDQTGHDPEVEWGEKYVNRQGHACRDAASVGPANAPV